MSSVLSALGQFVDQHPISAYLLVLIAAIAGALVGTVIGLGAFYIFLDLVLSAVPCMGPSCGQHFPML